MYILPYTLENNIITVQGHDNSTISYNLKQVDKGNMTVPLYYKLEDNKIIRVQDGKVVCTLGYEYA